ncbi:gamma-glutamylcyclotransferase [Chachezhania antarctica]|uniref:gamma-glutamylcyclotransferase n=1 Tax=Chachezhania antarctica TaxID=2340860 RepID=UPI000EAC53C1|nr:gamma-glutamylcyclotransferase [Chachezhania antarctica]
MTPDPFQHHPELRALIHDPLESYFRTFEPSEFDEVMKANNIPPDWRQPDAQREALRCQLLEGRRDEDLWIFAYGSLMWDPAIRFSEVRRAHAPNHVRRFILKDNFGARGSPGRPGVMAALDEGEGCDGLIFRIPKEIIEEETIILWKRERIGPAYIETAIPVETDIGTLEAVTFVANHEADNIHPDLCWEDQVQCCATGVGRRGSSFDYVANLAGHFTAMGIDDPDVSALLSAAQAYRDGLAAE